MLTYGVNDNSAAAVLHRKGMIDAKKADVLQRLNEDLRQGPLGGYLEFGCIGVERGFTLDWDVTFYAEDGRKVIVRGNKFFFHIYEQPDKHLHRTNNRIKAYLRYLATSVKKYSDELNTFRKEFTLG